ncbi:MAG: AraC family transcriptional regulator, partial [bacterium]
KETALNPTRPKKSPRKVAAASPDTARLAALIRAYAPHDGTFDLRIKGLHVTRRSRPYSGQVRDLIHPAICLVAQGRKTALLGKEAFTYDAERLVVFSVDMPLGFRIDQASLNQPYLGLRLDLDPRRMADLVPKVYPHGLPKGAEGRAVLTGQADPGLIEAAVRLLELTARPEDAELLAPLAVEEILIRLLRGSIGPRVARMGFAKSGVPGIARAVSWLCEHFDQPFKAEALADVASMSLSALHHQFKSVTSMSPLQYQKTLRLQEARRLMLAEMLDAGAAGQRVGYLSASQFSREYGRLFGQPPTRDVELLREQGMAQAES